MFNASSFLDYSMPVVFQMVQSLIYPFMFLLSCCTRGLMCMHRLKIVHRDLKSANCLVNKYWTVKICDFGLSQIMSDSAMNDNSPAGTPEWMAPELIRNEPFTKKCDIFSFGVIMWELCTLSRPWEGIPPVQVATILFNSSFFISCH